jgi:hypothetical protein
MYRFIQVDLSYLFPLRTKSSDTRLDVGIFGLPVHDAGQQAIEFLLRICTIVSIHQVPVDSIAQYILTNSTCLKK